MLRACGAICCGGLCLGFVGLLWLAQTLKLMADERQLAPAAVAARDGHPWLQSALEKLEQERVVCVRVTREATVQRPVLGGAPPAEGEGDAASKKPAGAAPALDR